MFAEHCFSKNSNAASNSRGRRGYKKEEELFVRKRNAESDHQRLWAGVDDYFKTWDVQVNRFASWSSPEFYSISCDSQLKVIKAQEKEANLEKRRRCLIKLLEKEESEYNEELKHIKNHNRLSENIKANKNKVCHINLEIKRRNDEASRRENELKLYHHYTILQPDLYHKQYNYFANKPRDDETKDNHGKTDNTSFNCNRNLDKVIFKNRLKAEVEILKSSIIKLKTEVMQFIKEMEKYSEKMSVLKTQEMKRMELISNLTSCFKDLMKEEDKSKNEKYEQLSSAEYLEYWRKKSITVQNELKQQIIFLDDAIKVAELFSEFSLKYELEKLKQFFSKKLLTEIGREKLSDLFECTYREPWIWWKEECKMWKTDSEERRKHLTEIYLKLETMEEKWCCKNLEEQEKLVISQESAIAELEKMKAEIEKNEQLLEELQLIH